MFAAHANHPGKVMETLAVAGGFNYQITVSPVSPCGACRQVMAEYQRLGGKPMKVILYGTEKIRKFAKVDDILPFIFDSLFEK